MRDRTRERAGAGSGQPGRDRTAGWKATLTKARAERGGLIPAIEFLNREGRLSPILPMKQTPLGEIVATYHLGDPYSVRDSWRAMRRRDLLYPGDPLQARFRPR